MRILIDGREAVLKEGSSFDFTAENRLFLGRDGYTLNMTFPLRDCPENRAIFGHVERMDMKKDIKSFECIIEDISVSLYGSLKIVKVSEASIDCQFAEGRCSQTMDDPFEETFVNELDLGKYPEGSPSTLPPSSTWGSIDSGASAVALPWINNSYPTAPNNWVSYESGKYVWSPDVYFLSWQPYLIIIAKKICDAVGYIPDFTEWENSNYRHLIICNTLPGTWQFTEFSKVLPKWSVSEFFEKLELLLLGEFEIDHRAKTVTFRFTSSVLSDIAPVQLSEPVDTYAVDVNEEGRCEYIGTKRLLYKDSGHSLQNYYSCDWLIPQGPYGNIYPNVSDMIEKNKKRTLSGGTVVWGHGHDTWNRGRNGGSVDMVLYAEAEDTHFVFRSIGVEETGKHFNTVPIYAQVYVLQSVNVFGSGKKESESVATEEIEFVPVCLLDTYVSQDDDQGFMMCLNPSNSDDSPAVIVNESGDTGRPGNMGLGSVTMGYNDSDVHQPSAAASIEAGEKDRESEYYDVVYVAFWDGVIPEPGKAPYPAIDYVWVSQNWNKIEKPGFSLRLYGNSSRNYVNDLPQIDTSHKFKFSWIGNDIPNPRAIFYISGKRYLCEKITATFTESGMSQLLKGEFYPLLDD